MGAPDKRTTSTIAHKRKCIVSRQYRKILQLFTSRNLLELRSPIMEGAVADTNTLRACVGQLITGRDSWRSLRRHGLSSKSTSHYRRSLAGSTSTRSLAYRTRMAASIPSSAISLDRINRHSSTQRFELSPIGIPLSRAISQPFFSK